MREQWHPESWKAYPAKQQPVYNDQEHLRRVTAKIASYPPLVFRGEVSALRQHFAAAARGESFVLQGGDCAERFQDCNQGAITSKIKILLQMSVILCYGLRRPVVRVGRIAGQYAKPRSKDLEVVDGVEMPIFRGDSVNAFEADAQGRQPDPDRLLQGYYCAAASLNYIRALVTGGFADLHYPEHWNLDYFAQSPQKHQYDQIVESIKDALAFFESLGGVRSHTMDSIDFYTSHEGLLLPFETAMTRLADDGRYYNLGAHMLWIGDRTRALDQAHVEYFRGIQNPVGIKVGPTADPQVLLETLELLNPNREEGRIVLITRFGAAEAESRLPGFLSLVKDSGHPVLWTCDPMHGNIMKTKSGVKTRDFRAILDELRQTFAAHAQEGTILGGVHFELTGEDVTECIGGTESVGEEDLKRSYETFCDPRLNYSQSLEMAFLLSNLSTSATNAP